MKIYRKFNHYIDENVNHQLVAQVIDAFKVITCLTVLIGTIAWLMFSGRSNKKSPDMYSGRPSITKAGEMVVPIKQPFSTTDPFQKSSDDEKKVELSEKPSDISPDLKQKLDDKLKVARGEWPTNPVVIETTTN